MVVQAPKCVTRQVSSARANVPALYQWMTVGLVVQAGLLVQVGQLASAASVVSGAAVKVASAGLVASG